jgi:hypothetical protein
MILIEKTSIIGLSEAIRGMRNPMNSWDKSDSGICKGGVGGIDCHECADYGHDCSPDDHYFHVGKNDHELMMKLVKGGSVHGKFRRMIAVHVDVTAPLYWWKEFDTYKVGTVANSCSTMHKIHAKEFVLDDFSHEHLIYEESRNILSETIISLNHFREAFLVYKQDDETKKAYWWQMIQLLPSSYNQKRTVMLNYEVLAGIYEYRRNHKLDEWREFCQWIEKLPYSELII